jgi:hypothetical protein
MNKIPYAGDDIQIVSRGLRWLGFLKFLQLLLFLVFARFLFFPRMQGIFICMEKYRGIPVSTPLPPGSSFLQIPAIFDVRCNLTKRLEPLPL